MSYSEWVELFEKFKNTNLDKDLLNTFISAPNNPSIAERLTERFNLLVNERLQLSVNKLTSDLDTMFNDKNFMDFMLVGFKKEITYLVSMLQVKFLSDQAREDMKNGIKEKVDEIYKILDDKALEIDYTGVLSMMIKSNGIKWS